MASFLKEKEEIKKEEKKKLPTITIAIIAHGEDLIDENIEIDPNVRIYSRAGQPLCLNIASSNPLNTLYGLYLYKERLSGEDNRTSYEMLEQVSENYKTPLRDQIFIDTITHGQEYSKLSKSEKHTIKTIANQKHSQIYTPSHDHKYIFLNDGPLKNQIAVLETKNHTSKSNINYQELPNLVTSRYRSVLKLYSSSLEMRNKSEENRISDFFKKFNLTPMSESDLNEDQKKELVVFKKNYAINKSEVVNPVRYLTNEKMLKYSKDIYENRQLIFVDGFVSEEKLLIELENPDSKIYDYITYPEDKEIIEKTINEIKNLESDDEELRSQKIKKRSKFYVDGDDNIISCNIFLSTIIKFLKTEGFEVINIIDLSCRSVEQKVSKDRIRILNEKQEMMASEIKKGFGRKRTQKTKRLRQIKKRTQRRKRA